MLIRITIIGLLLNLTALAAMAQENRLSVDRIFDSNEFRSDSYHVNWMPQGGKYYIKNGSQDGSGEDIVLVDPLTGEQTVLIAANQMIPEGGTESIDITSFQVSPDKTSVLVFNNTKRVWRHNTRGDYWVADMVNGSVKKLGGKNAAESTLMFAKFSPDSKSVAYVRDRNIFVEQLESGKITQITETESDHIINGTSDWVYEEELDVRDSFQWSDNGKQIVYWRFDTSRVGLFTMINNTDELYPRLIQFQYPKVGTTNSAVTICLFDVSNGKTTLVDLPGDPREHYPARINWIPNRDEFLLQRFNRLQNTNTIYAVDATTGDFRQVFQDIDNAWVEVCDWIEWWPDGKYFSFISERDGWKHVYLVNVDNGQLQLLTPGEFDVVELYDINHEEQACYFLASPDDAKCRYLYRQVFGRPQIKRLTPESETGWHEYSFSSDGRFAIHSWSEFGVPSRIATIGLPDHNTIHVDADNAALKEKLAQLAPNHQEFFQVTIDDGHGGDLIIDAWVMRPIGFDSAKKYPALVYVYGEPWGTTVTDQWGGNRYLWHRMLCEQGYAVFSFDNRGAKCARGSAWRKAIYKKIGVINASDQAAALRATLDTFDWIDRERIGIWGWSGGGSSTLNALFQYPDLYRTGISVAPVPDQRYYDTIYQERYMQTPELNPEGFQEGSPITHAENLKGNLLLIHGTGDDNCHYQTMELLINKLIAHDKSFEMMAYPNRSHGIHEYKNTTPHLRKLMTRYLHTHLPSGPAAVGDGSTGFRLEKVVDEELARFFPRKIDVFGINVFSTETTEDTKVIHAATILAEYLDNDEDGLVDNEDVVKQMIASRASLLMTRDEQELEELIDQMPESLLDRYSFQPLWEKKPGPTVRQRVNSTRLWKKCFTWSLTKAFRESTRTSLANIQKAGSPRRWIWRGEVVFTVSRTSIPMGPGIPTTILRATTNARSRSISIGA